MRISNNLKPITSYQIFLQILTHYIKYSLIIYFISPITYVISQNSTFSISDNYSLQTYKSGDTYKMKPTPLGVNYESQNACVTFDDLIEYNYTARFENIVNYENVYPENFCYSMLRYNISRDDFFNIINKNLHAFKNFRRLMTFWTIFYESSATSIKDQCAGYFRNMACWSEFPACIDNKDSTWTASGICETFCDDYKVRCGIFALESFCNHTSSLSYCAGINSAGLVKYTFALFTIVLVLILF